MRIDALAEEGRLEEGQPADVIEMKVAEEDVDLVGCARRELVPERGQSGAGVDDEQTLAAADLDARRVPAELAKAPARGADASRARPRTGSWSASASSGTRHNITTTLIRS